MLDVVILNTFFINCTKTIEELILIFYNSTQDYHDYKLLINHIYPKIYNFCSVNTASCLYYSTEYDSDYDDDDDEFEEFAETIQSEREMFYSEYNNLCLEMVCLKNFIAIKHL